MLGPQKAKDTSKITWSCNRLGNSSWLKVTTFRLYYYARAMHGLIKNHV